MKKNLLCLITVLSMVALCSCSNNKTTEATNTVVNQDNQDNEQTSQTIVDVPDHSMELGRTAQMVGIQGVANESRSRQGLPTEYIYETDEAILNIHGTTEYHYMGEKLETIEANEIFYINWMCGNAKSSISVFDENQLQDIIASYDNLYGEHKEENGKDTDYYTWKLGGKNAFNLTTNKTRSVVNMYWENPDYYDIMNSIIFGD